MAMATLHKNDPARAREYFEDKMAFITGLLEFGCAGWKDHGLRIEK